MRSVLWMMVPAAGALLSGCVAKTALDVATMPVRAGSQAADWATTSQEEADRNYGRKMRKQEAEQAREAKRAERDRQRRCRAQGREDC